MENSINNTNKTWLIVSWQHVDHMDGAYGKCLDHFVGTYADAAEAARKYVPTYYPVGVVGAIE